MLVIIYFHGIVIKLSLEPNYKISHNRVGSLRKLYRVASSEVGQKHKLSLEHQLDKTKKWDGDLPNEGGSAQVSGKESQHISLFHILQKYINISILIAMENLS